MDDRAIAWLNGRLVDADAPQITLRDHGFTVGDGVFESVNLTPADRSPSPVTCDAWRAPPAGWGWPSPTRRRCATPSPT